VFKYEDQGVATLEDSLYVLEDRLKKKTQRLKPRWCGSCAPLKGGKYAEAQS
jgi:hypothetical protein